MSLPSPPSVPAIPAMLTLAERELVRFFRQRNRVFGALGQPIIFWLLFSEGLRSRDLGYAHFFPGTLAMILLFTAIFATISIIEDRNEGFLQGVLVAPVPRWAMVFGKILGAATIALFQAILFLILGWITVPQVSPEPIYALGAVGLLALMSISLTGLGFLIAWRMDSTHAFHAIMSVFLLPMWLLSGAFFPQGAEGVLGWIVILNPLTYGVAGLRRYLLLSDGIITSPASSFDGVPPLWLCWGVTAAFAVVMVALCCRIAYTRTRGDLK